MMRGRAPGISWRRRSPDDSTVSAPRQRRAPGGRGHVARLAQRHIRLTVLVSVVLICGSFAAATSLQMRLDRVHALAQAARLRSPPRRRHRGARRRARSTGIARAGLLYAGNPDAGRRHRGRCAGLRNIAVFGRDGEMLARLHRPARSPPLPPASFTGKRASFGPAFSPFPTAPRRGRLLRRRRAAARGAARARGALVDGGGAASRRARAGRARPRRRIRRAGLAARRGDADRREGRARQLVRRAAALSVRHSRARRWSAPGSPRSSSTNSSAAPRRPRRSAALKSARPVEARLLVRLANAERGAVEAARSKSEFIAHMSHELRTPLNAIIGFSEVIERGLFGPAGHPKYVEYAHDIAEAGRGLHAKIGDVLEFANVEAGRYPIARRARSTSPIWRRPASTSIAAAPSRGASRLDIGLGGPRRGARRSARGQAHPRQSSSPTRSLYTARGRHRARRRDERGRRGRRARCATAAAASPAAEKDTAGRAFQRFDRPGTVTGAGLGLAIAVGLARRMGGAIRFASAPGEGTVMELRLPRP